MIKPFVAILMGSDADFLVMKLTVEVLTELAVSCEVRMLSAHRTQEQTKVFILDAESHGCQVFIAAAGLAAQILSVTDTELARRLVEERAENAKAPLEQDQQLQSQL